MNYLLRNKPRRNYPVRSVLVGVLFVFIVFLGWALPGFLRNLGFHAARPIWFISEQIARPFSGILNFFSFKNTLIDKNIALESEVESLKLKEIDYDTLSKENIDLKNELGRKTFTSRVVARIISRPPASPYDTVVIDSGSADGVLLGSKVYLSDSMIVGTISNVTPHTSLVELFSNGSLKKETLLARTGAGFVLEGQGGGNFKLDVPKDTDILWGDNFMYPGLSTALVGTVYYIDTNSQSSFKTVYLRLPVNVFSSKYLYVE